MRRLWALLFLVEMPAWVQGDAYLPAAYEKACDAGVLDSFGEHKGSEEEAAVFRAMREKRSFGIHDYGCNCGSGTKYCMQQRGRKTCLCQNDAIVINYYCSHCSCANGICDESSECRCKEGYGLKDDNTCEECNCGDRMPCKFAEGMKLCLCYNEFISVNRGCKGCSCGPNEMCFDTHEVCSCSEESSYPKCNVLREGECDCSRAEFCSYGDIEVACKCLPNYVRLNGTCTLVADCKCEDENAVCDLQNGTKVCSCKDRFVEHNGTCVECFCGEGHSCELKNGSTACTCQEGHFEHEGICKECICGENEDCELRDGYKFCTCKENYVLVAGVCRECFCGEGHGCDYLGGIGKLCTCRKYFAEIGGICKECHCGGGHDCEFRNGTKNCVCSPGFSENNGTCMECHCGDGHYCEFLNGSKICSCSPGFSEKSGTCVECFCGENSDCSFDAEDKVCMCNNGSVFKNEMCHEICRNDTCDQGTCEIEDDTFKCSCDIGFGGDRCDEKLAVSKEAMFVIYTLIVVTIFWIVLVAVYFIRKKRKRDPSYQKVSEGGTPNDGVFMSTVASRCDR